MHISYLSGLYFDAAGFILMAGCAFAGYIYSRIVRNSAEYRADCTRRALLRLSQQKEKENHISEYGIR